jgi:paraquat-inducible protein B
MGSPRDARRHALTLQPLRPLSQTEPNPPPAVTPEFRTAQRWNIVWVVPIIALLIGSWMIYRSFSSQGPVAEVSFETADGLMAGKTEVRCRSVRVGVVKTVKLSEDLKSVMIHLELDSDSENLLRQGTSFWVVRPRISTTNITGLGTLITGAYLELDPGPLGGIQVNHYKGLEAPPATNRNIPGRRLILTADEAGSLAVDSPIYYRGIEVGRIESRKLDMDGQRIAYEAFIQADYANLVKENTRFWNTSGIDISAGADGFKVRTPSFVALVSGGATFGVLEGVEPGKLAPDGASFTLFANEEAANCSTFNSTMKFVLLFDQSVRGLVKGAPLEYRGIAVGRVADISFDYLKGADETRIPAPIPVLVELDPSLLRREAAESVSLPGNEFLKQAVKRGLRASLKTGSLLTGALFVDLDYWKSPSPAELSQVGDFLCLPTETSTFAQLESDLPLLMKKVDSFIAEATATAAGTLKTLESFEDTMASVRKTLDSEAFLKLPSDLRDSLTAFQKTASSLEKTASSVGPGSPAYGDLLRTLDETRSALRSLSALTTNIDEKPNSILFGRDSSGNPIPKAPRAKP